MKTTNGQIANFVERKKTWTRLLLLFLILVVLIFQPRFSSTYSYIKREEVEKHLVQTRDIETDLEPDLQYCDYENIILDTTTIPIPFGGFAPAELNERVQVSGQFAPTQCKPRYQVAVIIPYRNRSAQLEIFLPYMHNFLQKQLLDYRIFVIQQGDSGPWNKGKLLNAASQIVKRLNYQCMILHDVDMLPLSPSHLYACTSEPRHMSASVDKFRFHLPYDYLIGGALAILQEQYESVNGFSNKFEMWGGEDDDFYHRLISENITIVRFAPEMSRYTMMVHSQESENPQRFQLLRDNRGRHWEDGLSTLTYKHITITSYPLYTNITVELN